MFQTLHTTISDGGWHSTDSWGDPDRESHLIPPSNPSRATSIHYPTGRPIDYHVHHAKSSTQSSIKSSFIHSSTKSPSPHQFPHQYISTNIHNGHIPTPTNLQFVLPARNTNSVLPARNTSFALPARPTSFALSARHTSFALSDLVAKAPGDPPTPKECGEREVESSALTVVF
jgi:hypothetical protein